MTDKPMTDSQIQQAIEDALIYGTGVIRMTHDDDGGVSVERVDQKEIRIEEPQAKYGEWMPIETAPKDKNIILFCHRRGVIRGKWFTDQYAKKPIPYWTNDLEVIFGIRETRADQPTHWMPLPEPPALNE